MRESSELLRIATGRLRAGKLQMEELARSFRFAQPTLAP